MKHFLLRYVTAVLVLMLFEYVDFTGLSEMLNRWQTQITLYGISYFIDASYISSDMLIVSSQLKLQITQACNGMLPFFFYLAGVAASRTSLWEKLLWSIIGYVVITIANVGRIVSVYYLSKTDPTWFDPAHHVAGNLLMVSVVMALLLLFFKKAKPDSV